MTETRNIPIKRERLSYIIWIVIFAVIMALGNSIFAGTLPPEPITRAIIIGPFVATTLCLTKLILNTKFCIFHTFLIATVIAIFTFWLGPPNIYKPIFVLAGLSFDAGSLFKTKDITVWHLMGGMFAYGLVGGALFVLTLYLIDVDIANVVKGVVIYGVGIFYLVAIPVTIITYKIINPKSPPKFVINIRNQITNE